MEKVLRLECSGRRGHPRGAASADKVQDQNKKN